MSWLLLQAAAGQHYARLYYEDTDQEGRPFPGGMPQGLEFRGGEHYFRFYCGLILAVSDVNVTSVDQLQFVLLYSLVSFFYFTTILGIGLNAIVTS